MYSVQTGLVVMIWFCCVCWIGDAIEIWFCCPTLTRQLAVLDFVAGQLMDLWQSLELIAKFSIWLAAVWSWFVGLPGRQILWSGDNKIFWLPTIIFYWQLVLIDCNTCPCWFIIIRCGDWPLDLLLARRSHQYFFSDSERSFGQSQFHVETIAVNWQLFQVSECLFGDHLWSGLIDRWWDNHLRICLTI